ncbi:hypothetical protein BG004_000441, partial [Podila humilis]
MAGSPSTSARSSRVLAFPKGQFYIQSPIANLVLDIESGFLKDPLKAGARVELSHKKSPKHNADSSLVQQEQQQWREEEGYIVNTRTGHVLDLQGGVVRSGTRVIQNVRKTGKDAAGQHWLNDDGVLTLASNPKFVVTIDGDANRDGTRITIQEKKPYNEKQKWLYLNGFDTRPVSPSPSRAESISIRPDNFPTSWFYIKSQASGLVVDIEHGYFTDPMKAGARAEMNHQKIDNGDGRHSLLELQLWRYEAGFLINRRTDFVLDIQGGTLKLAARVVQWQRKSGKEAQNQHWFYENGYIANVYNSRLVLDIDGDGSKDGAKIAIGERKALNNSDQKWVLEEARFNWLAGPASSSASLVSTKTEEVVLDRAISSPQIATSSTTVTVLPTSGWFYIKSQSSGLVVDVEQDADPMAPNVLAIMNAQITHVTEENQAKVESQLWRYNDGQIINRRSQLVLDCKQGVVRYGARLMQGIPKQGKESHHQRWESSNGTLVIQGKPLYAIDIEGDGTKAGARLSLQRPKVQNNSDQQWSFQMATFEWLNIERVVTRTFTETSTISSQLVNIEKNDWFFIKSSATGLVMDLEAGWITQPTDVGAYISMKKQRSLQEKDRSLLERQLWRYDDGYLVNRKTNYVIDIYGRSAVVGVKLIQQYKATTEAEGKTNQLWNVVDGNIQLLHNPKLAMNVVSNKDGSLVQLSENKAVKSTISTWSLELARASWLQTSVRSSTVEDMEEANVSVHAAFPQDKWFYIKSKASGLVLDVEHGFWRDHTKPGTCIELNNQKLYGSASRHALLELQLWKFEAGFIINRRTGLVLDVYGSELKHGTKVIQWTRKSEGNVNQQWVVSNGFIHLKSQPNLVLDVDGDGTRDGARISLGERKDKKNLDQRWSFEAVTFTWLTTQTSYISTSETDEELLKEYESSHLARVREHSSAPTDCWFYLKSGISDLVLEIEHSRQVNHLKSGTHVQLAHQRLKSGKHSHALLELQLWRFQDGYIINRRSGLVLAVDGLQTNSKLIQATKTGAETQRWVIEDGVLRLAAHRKFALFLSYGRNGSRAFIREVRRDEHVQRWSFAEVRFSWLTLERTLSEQVEEEQLEVVNESETSYLTRELVSTREIKTFTKTTYFYIRTSNGYVVDIEHGLFKNHMKAGAYATLHPQTTAASANQHAILDIQLWSYVDGYLINKRTGLALTIQGDLKESGARLVQELPHNAIKWTLEGGYIFPQENSQLVISIRNDQIVLVERSVAVTWTVYEASFAWLVWTEVVLLTTEQEEDTEFYEEYEEIVVRSSARAGEVIEYAITEQHVIAPKESWFYLVAGCKVVAINYDQITERGHCDGASISLVAQKRFSSTQRHALLELQLWKYENQFIINRYTGLYLTVDSNGSLITTTKQTDVTRQQWHFSEDGSLSLVSVSTQVVDFVNDSAVLVERSAGKTVWLYDTIQASWLTSLETSTRTDYKEVQSEITEYHTVYTRYIQYITKYTVTVRTTTRRVIRVHSQSSLQNATVYEQDNTAWACHLVEGGTGVEYVMQLLHDNTTDVYYIYVQWGSIEGQLEGPYESAEKATIEFQEIFSSKIGFEWTEREVAISGDSWTSVEFEYDTITVEDEFDSSREAVGATQSTRTTTIVSAPKSLVDIHIPNADQINVYYDSEIYHTMLTERTTGVVYVSQLLFNHVTKTYYVYLRWGESEYSLDGPFESVQTAKARFNTKYTETFGFSWEERKTVTNTEWSVVQQTFETTDEYIEYVSDNEQVDTITSIGQTIEGSTDEHTTVVTKTETVINKPIRDQTERITKTSSIVVSEPKTIKKNSWFQRLATGAGVAAVGALTQVDGVWKRNLNVLTTRKGHVDSVSPIAKNCYVYYDDAQVYDSVLIEKSTGVKYITQLVFDVTIQKYYVYIRYSETDYKLDGPHDTVESAKSALHVTYKERFGLEWESRETTISEQWNYEFQTYETYETIEEIEEIVEEEEAQVIIAHEREIQVSEGTVKTEVVTTTTENEVILETVKEDILVVDEQVESKETVVTKIEEDQVKVDISIEKIVEEVQVIEDHEEATKTKHTTTVQTGVIAQPAVTKNTSWFRKFATGATAVAAGALTKVDGVWKRPVKVVTTHKAKVDKVAPIAKTSVVYFDENVYDSVVVEKTTGVKHITQLLYDTKTNAYYIYTRSDETNYKLDGPHETIESAKTAFQVTYQANYGISWETRETTVSEQWTYEVQTYETYETIEEIEEIIEEEEAQVIIAREESISVAGPTSTTVVKTIASGDIVLGDEKKETIKESVIVHEEVKTSKPAVSGGSSWFKKAIG